MIVLYGATGYTGRLVARGLADAGLDVVLAGRRQDAVGKVAEPLGLEVRAGALDRVDLDGATALLNCAGPFARTQAPLLEGCLRAGVHYLDLAGEVAEHRSAQAADSRARQAGILVLPGAGFGIVPSDCLAAHVASQVEAPRRLELALKTVGGVSRGTAEVVLGGLRTSGVRRRDGRLEERRAGAGSLRVDFEDGDGPTRVVTNPWRADLLAGTPEAGDSEAFMAFPAPVRALMRVPHGSLVRRVAARLPEGPTAASLAKGRSAVWARVTGADGSTAQATLRGPDAYLFTALTAEACLRRVLAGDAPTGFHTPAGAWGPGLLAGLRGVASPIG